MFVTLGKVFLAKAKGDLVVDGLLAIAILSLSKVTTTKLAISRDGREDVAHSHILRLMITTQHPPQNRDRLL